MIFRVWYKVLGKVVNKILNFENVYLMALLQHDLLVIITS